MTGTKTQKVEYIKLKDFDKFYINPFNPRDLSKQKIELVQDENGYKFALSRDVVCSEAYRKSMNALIDSLVIVRSETLNTVEGQKTTHKASFVVTNPTRVTPVDNGTATDGHLFLGGNTRWNLLCQVIEILGEDNVSFSFPYIIDNGFDKNNYLVELLTSGFVDNTGVVVESSNETHWTMLDKAYDANLDLDFDSVVDWIKNNLVYTNNSDKTSTKQVNNTLFSKWVTPKRYPHIAEAIDQYVSKAFQSSFINKIYQKYSTAIENDQEYLSIIVGLLQEFCTNETKKEGKITSQTLLDKFATKVEEYFTPAVETPLEGTTVNTDSELPTEETPNEEIETYSIDELVKSVKDLSYVALEFDFSLLDEKSQTKVKGLLARVDKILRNVHNMTLERGETSTTEETTESGETDTESLEVMAQ